MSMEFVKYLVRPGFSIWGKNHSQVIPYSSTEKPEFQCLKISFTEKKKSPFPHMISETLHPNDLFLNSIA